MRKFNILLLAAAALITGCAKKELLRTNADGSPKNEQHLKVAGSAVGDVVGKLTVGYQGWFAAPAMARLKIDGRIGLEAQPRLPVIRASSYGPI